MKKKLDPPKEIDDYYNKRDQLIIKIALWTVIVGVIMILIGVITLFTQYFKA